MHPGLITFGFGQVDTRSARVDVDRPAECRAGAWMRAQRGFERVVEARRDEREKVVTPPDEAVDAWLAGYIAGREDTIRAIRMNLRARLTTEGEKADV